jgi:hypothetical protein
MLGYTTNVIQMTLNNIRRKVSCKDCSITISSRG